MVRTRVLGREESRSAGDDLGGLLAPVGARAGDEGLLLLCAGPAPLAEPGAPAGAADRDGVAERRVRLAAGPGEDCYGDVVHGARMGAEP